MGETHSIATYCTVPKPSAGKKQTKKTIYSIKYIVGILTANVSQLALKMWVWVCVWEMILIMDEIVTEFWFCDLHFHFVLL